MSIIKTTGKITKIIDLSKTAKEISVTLPNPLNFIAGSFVNIFLDIGGERIRRAYSISSSPLDLNEITLTIRLSPDGLMTPYFWNNDMHGRELEIMGPLGLNTVDKMKQDKIYLFAFGVGVGVVKSIADYFCNIKKVSNLIIITGSRSEEEILYKNYFKNLKDKHQSISVLNVVSKPNEGSSIPKGYIQDYISGFDFNDSDVYVCGQEKACLDLVEKIKSSNPKVCNFFIEGFH